MQKIAVMALALGTALTLTAQQGPQNAPGGPGGPRPGFGPRMGFFPGPGPWGFGGPGGPGGPVVTNQPYAATEKTVDMRTNKDGKKVTHEVPERNWRDAVGRTRVEVTLPAEGKRPEMHHAEIFDPVAHTITSLDFAKKVAIVRHLPPPRDGHRRPPQEDRPQHTPPGVTVTDLPGKEIAGVYATGKEIKRTIPAGAHGNPEPIVEISKRYVSPDLKIVMYSSEDGPRNKMEHAVTSLERVDPNEALFEVPQDFTVKDAPEHGWRGPRGQHGPPPPSGE